MVKKKILLKATVKENFSETLKFFGPTTLKWYPLKIFSKMRKKHLLTANIF